MVRWDVPRRELFLLTSTFARDPLFWASKQDRVAVGPKAQILSSLLWVGRELNPESFMLLNSRKALREAFRGKQTFWKGISAVASGDAEVFQQGQHTTVAASARPEPEFWHGSFDEATEALTAVLGRVLRQRVQRHRRSALMLSGGLDSTLITWIASQARGDAEIFCLTSAAPEGSDLKDEREFSRAVADACGLSMHLVRAPEGTNVYRPSDQTFNCGDFIQGGPRFYLDEAFNEAAKEYGATAMFNGAMGEFSITDKRGFDDELNLRGRVGATKRAVMNWFRSRRDWPSGAFHIRFSPERLAAVPTTWREGWLEGKKVRRHSPPHQPRGYHPSFLGGSGAGTAAQGLRMHLPFSDFRLSDLAARMPREFDRHGGLTRSLARHMLEGHIPDAVRLRTRGMAYSPEYMQRIEEQAVTVLPRLPLYREAGVDEWLDLDWLAAALQRVSEPKHRLNVKEAFETQLTTVFAEFLLSVGGTG